MAWADIVTWLIEKQCEQPIADFSYSQTVAERFTCFKSLSLSSAGVPLFSFSISSSKLCFFSPSSFNFSYNVTVSRDKTQMVSLNMFLEHFVIMFHRKSNVAVLHIICLSSDNNTLWLVTLTIVTVTFLVSNLKFEGKFKKKKKKNRNFPSKFQVMNIQ